MENPQSWPPAVHVIVEAMRQHDISMDNGEYGFSVFMRIYLALKNGGYLSE